MKVFVDTSTLFKKYYKETGTSKLFGYLNQTTELFVAPITQLEITNSMRRYHHLEIIPSDYLNKVLKEINQDFPAFTKIIWNDALENSCFDIITLTKMKTLDAIQLASAIVSKAKLFITSDKKLYEIGRKELPEVEFV